MKLKLSGKILLALTLWTGAALAQNQKAGTISPDARSIVHVTALYPFSEGLAILRNGNVYCVINEKTEIVVPYNKYQFYISDKKGYVNGMCAIIDDNRKKGFIDKQGKLIFPIQFGFVTPFLKEGIAYAMNYDKKIDANLLYILNKDGTRILINNRNASGKKIFDLDPENWSEGLCPIYESKSGPYSRGYLNALGKIAIPFQYIGAQPFSNGLAAVSKKDDFGNVKWGFINKSNQVVIPFQFSNEPYPFTDGISIIKPLNIPDFNYGLIDKTGNVIAKFKTENDSEGWHPRMSATDDFGEFKNGIAPWSQFRTAATEKTQLNFMDKTGRNFSFDKNINDAGYEVIQSNYMIQGNKICFYGKDKNGSVGMGVIDTRGEMIISPVFRHISDFDPVSNLAYAEYQNGSDMIIGYINPQGIFVIVTKEKTGF